MQTSNQPDRGPNKFSFWYELNQQFEKSRKHNYQRNGKATSILINKLIADLKQYEPVWSRLQTIPSYKTALIDLIRDLRALKDLCDTHPEEFSYTNQKREQISFYNCYHQAINNYLEKYSEGQWDGEHIVILNKLMNLGTLFEGNMVEVDLSAPTCKR